MAALKIGADLDPRQNIPLASPDHYVPAGRAASVRGLRRSMKGHSRETVEPVMAEANPPTEAVTLGCHGGAAARGAGCGISPRRGLVIQEGRTETRMGSYSPSPPCSDT